MSFLLSLAWRDLRASGRSLWIFCACLVLGVTLVSASGGLYRLVGDGLLADTRALLGGDVQVASNQPKPLPDEAVDWMKQNGTVSQLIELRTMLGTPQDDFVLVELQSVDDLYPLYGQLQLDPAKPLSESVSKQEGRWGVAIDHALSLRHDLKIGDIVSIGRLQMDVRALIMQQPDRNLSADWRGSPVLISPQAISDASLLQPGSRVDYDYRVATDVPAADWKTLFYERFPDRGWEVRTFEDRSERISERLGQIASGLLMIGFSTLFIGGLGVFSSIQSYLQGKLKTIATLRSLGLRNRRIAIVYLLQVGILGGGASLVGCVLGALLALLGSVVVASELPISTSQAALAAPLLSAFIFGLLTAFCFALPAIGSALSVSPASLFRNSASGLSVSYGWLAATAICALGIIALILISVPSLLFGAVFILVVALLLGLLEVTLQVIRGAAQRFDGDKSGRTNFAFRLALANLYRPASPLRSSLLSLGSALTLLVICTLVVVSLQRNIQATIPEEAPALVLYDISPNQVEGVKGVLKETSAQARAELAPLVQGRIVSVNGQMVASLLAANGAVITEKTEDLRDTLNEDHKLSYRGGNVDGIELVDGNWLIDNQSQLIPSMSLEDREARRIGVSVGDRISYEVAGKTLEFNIAAIHRQKGVQTRFWFEGIVADGALESSIGRYVGAAWMNDDLALQAQKRIAAVAPNVVTVRTARILASARELLGQATSGLLVVAVISFLASLLVLFSVIAASRVRQVYDASVLNALGVRLSVIRKSLYLEFLLIALVTALFAVLLGSAIAIPLLEWRMKLPSTDLIWVGLLTALLVSVSTLVVGAQYLNRRMSVRPAILLRNTG